ncbi:MAG: excinuclease ABC subunit C [Bacteroidales bacterium]|nr:excinuclease ABC subunit C [Bacteroidales bacterium]
MKFCNFVKEKISILPTGPGVYRFLDASGTIIYIGKAKNLRKRVQQYFVNPENLTTKTRMLVSKIADIQHTVVESEQDALLLENNLIKQYQPKYNILLKDGKSYPWICIKNEPYPKIFLTRRFVRDGSQYFGPYSSVQHAHHLLDLVNSLYKLRTCKLALTPQAIEAGKFKPCLNIHIKKCYGPCVGCITQEEYDSQIANIKEILRGNTGALIREYRKTMQEYAVQMEFEKAQEYKEKVELLQNHYSKSLIVHPSITDTDVFSIVFEKGNAFGNFFRLNGGCIIQALNLHFKLNIEEEKEAVLTRFIQEIYQIIGNGKSSGGEKNLYAEEILVPFLPDNLSFGKNIHIPLKGDKLNLLELCTKNAKAFMFQKMKQEEIKDPEEGKNRAVLALKEALQMERMPLHIECFDNSNTQGTNPVAACVVFRNGKPSKRDYRHFNIKTVVGANDYASMYEVVHRRYSRLLAEGGEIPQLVLIDGGRGQLHFAYDALQDLGLLERVKVISIAERLEEIMIPGDPTPMFMDKNSPALKLLMHLRDEAHRFGITHHRSRRTKNQITSTLTSIKGVGEATQQKLLQHFKSVKRIREASREEIETVVGRKMASLIIDALHPLQN